MKEILRVPMGRDANGNTLIVRTNDDGMVEFGDNLQDKYADFTLNREHERQLRNALTDHLGDGEINTTQIVVSSSEMIARLERLFGHFVPGTLDDSFNVQEWLEKKVGEIIDSISAYRG